MVQGFIGTLGPGVVRRGQQRFDERFRAMRQYVAVSCVLMLVGETPAQVVSYEGTSFPETESWERSTFCTPERLLAQGWLVQQVEPLECFDPPSGDRDSYVRSLSDFDGSGTFFVEWRVEADGPASEIPWGAPSALAVGSLGPVHYTFFIARDLAKLNRDNLLPIVFVQLAPGVPHTHRLELYGNKLYTWYIDGQAVDAGIPEGAFPSNTPSITWRARSAYVESVVRWDYIRYGVIPQDGSGDFNSDSLVDHQDYYFFHECLHRTAEIPDDPGCRWADMDASGAVDLLDFADFQVMFNAGE